MKNPINTTAQFITSSSAVTLGLLVIICAMIFETQTLLQHQLSAAGMHGVKLIITSYGLAIGIEFIILLFTANQELKRDPAEEKKVTPPLIFGISSFIINFFFWKAYDFSRPIEWILFSIFISALLAYINYSLSELFVRKWSAHVNEVDLQVKFDQCKMIKDDLEVNLNELQMKYDELESVSKNDKQNIKNIEHDYHILMKEAEEMRNKLSRKKKRKI